MGGFRKINRAQTTERLCKYCGQKVDITSEKFGTNQKEYWHVDCKAKAENQGN